MYAIVDSNQQHESLQQYIAKGFPDAVEFDDKKKMYVHKVNASMDIKYGGLINALKYTFYPKYTDSKRRRRTQKKGSNAKLGTRVDQEIAMFISKEKPEKRKKPHKMTLKVLDYLKELGHVLQAAQLPVYVERFGKITQADFVTLNTLTNRLHVWELKTGYTPGMYTTRGKGTFKYPLHDVKCTKYGIWELQRYWTARSLQESGLDVAASNIIWVYEDTKKKQTVVKVLDNLPWLKRFEEKPPKEKEKTNKRIRE